jgi:hypothetical protein
MHAGQVSAPAASATQKKSYDVSQRERPFVS